MARATPVLNYLYGFSMIQNRVIVIISVIL